MNAKLWGMERDIRGFRRIYVAVHYAKNMDTGRPLLEILLLRRRTLEIQFLFLETWSTYQVYVVLLSRVGPVRMD